MYMVDAEQLQKLSQCLNIAIQEHKHAIDDQKQLTLFRMNYIKKFTDDIFFLNDLSGNSNFHVRYANLILRNMVEQLIEFLYISKHTELVDEYLGSKISTDNSNKKKFIVTALRRFGDYRFSNRREEVSKMAADIKEKYTKKKNPLTLYNMYSILSDRCHNSYFSSLLDDFAKAFSDSHYIAVTQEQGTYLNTLIIIVLMNFPCDVEI